MIDTDAARLAELLRETAEHHGPYEASHAAHDWWDWYAAYMIGRQEGEGPEAAASGAGRYMTEVLHVASR